jgi:hypothetical protein
MPDSSDNLGLVARSPSSDVWTSFEPLVIFALVLAGVLFFWAMVNLFLGYGFPGFKQSRTRRIVKSLFLKVHFHLIDPSKPAVILGEDSELGFIRVLSVDQVTMFCKRPLPLDTELALHLEDLPKFSSPIYHLVGKVKACEAANHSDEWFQVDIQFSSENQDTAPYMSYLDYLERSRRSMGWSA